MEGFSLELLIDFFESSTRQFLAVYEDNFVYVFFEPIPSLLLEVLGLGDLPIPIEVWNIIDAWFNASLASVTLTLIPIFVLALAIVSLILDIVL